MQIQVSFKCAFYGSDSQTKQSTYGNKELSEETSEVIPLTREKFPAAPALLQEM